ncbi:B3 domain-containing protein REM10-like [Bidens hawaiensis]|uniref:B3 domain-containing protein REM10-like n=1 Tax=Bidens hawaiensis TaxID=980011 RepID=UPI004049FC52
MPKRCREKGAFIFHLKLMVLPLAVNIVVLDYSIPITFRKYLKSRRNNKTIVLKRGCQKWRVKMIDWAFSEGWDNFVRENGVQEFDIVVFKHQGNMVFDTMVFDTYWCEREYSNNQVTKSSTKCRIDNNELKKVPNEKATTPDHDHHSYFIGTLSSSFCGRFKLYLPTSFTRSNGLRTGEMILRNGRSQMSWTVELKIGSNSLKPNMNNRIGRGWHEFYIANGLKEGDQFKLELIQTGIKPIANFYNLSTKQSESHGMVEIPYFVGTLRESRDSRNRMYIPKEFAEKTGLSSGALILKKLENEGSWTVKLSNHLSKLYYIQSGLRVFCIANGLKKGDSLKFELIRSGEKPVAVVSSKNLLFWLK